MEICALLQEITLNEFWLAMCIDQVCNLFLQELQQEGCKTTILQYKIRRPCPKSMHIKVPKKQIVQKVVVYLQVCYKR